MYALRASSSFGVKGYILQLIFVGASGRSVMAWFSSLSGGNRCASSSENTLLWFWYSSGMAVSLTGSKVVATANFASWYRFLLKRYPPVRRTTGSPFSSCFFQSISGFSCSNQGYPKIILSSPKLVTKNWNAVSFSPLLTHNWHISDIVPSLFSDPSMFLTILGGSNGVVPNPNLVIRFRSMRLSVAPLSRSTFTWASFQYRRTVTLIVIALSRILYIEHASLSAPTDRCRKNPDPTRNSVSFLRHPWTG